MTMKIGMNKESDDSTIKNEEEELDDLQPMPPIEGDEELIEREELEILIPSKLTRLLVLFVQIKAGIDSNKLKNEFSQIFYLLYQHNNKFTTI